MATPEQEIQDAISEPKKVMIDGNVIENQDVDALVKAAEYLDKKGSQQKSRLGILRFRIRPGGSV